jgi:hypothetical protein
LTLVWKEASRTGEPRIWLLNASSSKTEDIARAVMVSRKHVFNTGSVITMKLNKIKRKETVKVTMKLTHKISTSVRINIAV